jgi:hypothetical protein
MANRERPAQTASDGEPGRGAEPEPSGAPRGSLVASPIVVGVSPVTGSRGRVPALEIIDASPRQRRAEQTLSEFVADALGEDHDVELRAVEGKAKNVLLKEAENAALLVLDSPAVAKLYEPSARRLAPHLIYRSPCPVVVMPPTPPEADLDREDFVGEYADEAAAQRSGSTA